MSKPNTFLYKVKYKRQLIFVVFLCAIVIYLYDKYVCSIDFTASQLKTSQVKNLVVENKKPSDNSVILTTLKVKSISTENEKPRIMFVDMNDIKKTAKNIFFIETRCSTEKALKNYLTNKGFVLNTRQCCAVESTALTNPDRQVFVFHSCPLSDDFLKHSPKFVSQLFSYPNVHVVRLNNTQLFINSPVQQLFEKRQLEESSYPVEHSSDVIRLLLLWRFGGTYCDLDVVTIRSLKELQSNWIGRQDATTLANGVLNFEPEGVANDMLQRMLAHINQHYDRSGWSTNGPLLVTSFILRDCNVSKLEDAESHCLINFTVQRKDIHYPIPYQRARDFFDHTIGHQILKDVNNSYTVHIWNKLSHDMVAYVGSTQAYALLAGQFCPKVYRNCGIYF